MPNAKTGYGTTIKIGTTTIGEVSSIGALAVGVDSIDTTVLADTFRSFIPGLGDGGELTISGNFYPSDTGQIALEAAVFAKSTDEYTITFPTSLGATWTFDGFITNYSTGEITADGQIPFDITVKITGEPDLGTSASTGMSAFTALGTAPVCTPAFAITNYRYTLTFTTVTAITTTVTAANHTINMYVDDAYTETITSGGTSSYVAFASQSAIHSLKYVVYSAGATAKTYEFMTSRTS